jgi:hypothetical protein
MGMTYMVGELTTKQRFTLEYHDELKGRIFELLTGHPVFSRLPVIDRENAAHCAATHGLIAIRSSSIERVALEMAS